MRLAVLGAGAWGSALSFALGQSSEVRLLARNLDLRSQLELTGENKRYLPGIRLPDSVRLAETLQDALADADAIVLAVPVKGVRETIECCMACLPELPPILVTCKGFERSTRLLPWQVVRDVMPGSKCAILSGPSFARDLGEGRPVLASLAVTDNCSPSIFSDVLAAAGIRTYLTDDLIGVSIGGATKNVVAIAAGMSDAQGFGASALAGLVTRGLSEISRLGCALGARSETFMGLSGLGDLSLTCFSDLSRNRRLGFSIGSGNSLELASRELGQVAEGVNTAYEVQSIAREMNIDMPITEAVCNVLSENLDVKRAADQLFSRNLRDET